MALDSTAQGGDALAILKSMVGIRQSHQQVHMVAMACLGGLMFGFTVLAQRLGLRRGPVVAGLIAYGAGTMLMFGATIIDGLSALTRRRRLPSSRPRRCAPVTG